MMDRANSYLTDPFRDTKWVRFPGLREREGPPKTKWAENDQFSFLGGALPGPLAPHVAEFWLRR